MLPLDPGDATEHAATPDSGEPPGETPGASISVGVGDRLGAYRIDRRLGAGGMGEVFAATRLRDDARMALKVLGRASPTHLYRFKREFRALADVEHANLIRLHELVVPRDGPAFFTMELVDGDDFTHYVRGRLPAGELANVERLERALRQLVAGVVELHTIDCVHRDLKPSNVLVDRSGRVVILDFGLVSELGNLDEGVTHDGQLLGTPAYMSPEQAMAGKAGPEADIYAIGVMLYECLTGQRPFSGSAMRVMLAKQDQEIPDPGAHVRGIPDPLRSLCMRLMAPDPKLRPTGRELLASLGEHDASVSVSVSVAPASSEARRRAPFVGRTDALGQLDVALRDVRETRRPVTMLVGGAGGIGKSTLLARFVAKTRARARALILTGRCLERESVPYKGVDAAIDALSVHLRRLPEVEAAALQPRHAVAMTRLFPVLADVWPQVGALPPSLDATEQRRLGLRAMRELVVRLCDRQPLVVCIDDFQWADLDSVELLAALLRPPDAPSLLLVLGLREHGEPSPAMRELRTPRILETLGARELELGPLSEAESGELARALVDDEARVAALVRRARGNPFLLTTLALGEDTDDGDEADVDHILARRIAELDAAARRVLALVAIAGGPIPLAALSEALATDANTRVDGAAPGEDPTARAIDRLFELGLLLELAASAEQGGGRLELAHAGVGPAVLAELEPATLEDLHLQLAAALEHHGVEHGVLADLFAEAGDRERAAAYAERGAIEAAEALAFARAVALYRKTIELLPDEAGDARRRTLKIELAEQLLNLGHLGEAGDLLLELAAGAEPGSAAGYRRRAVMALAQCGRIDEAIDILAALLDELGEPMPRSHTSGFLMFVRERIRLWLRGESFVRRDEAEIPADVLARLDTLIAASRGLSSHEVILTQALGARALRLAFDAGDPHRLSPMLGYRYVAHAGMGQFARATKMAVRSREVAAMTDDPEMIRGNDLSDAIVEWFRGDALGCKQMFGRLLDRGEDAPLADWIRSFATIRYAEMCMTCGHFVEFRRGHARRVARARARGNLAELASLEGLAATVCVYYDDLDQARVHLAAAREQWQPSRYTFTDVTLDIASSAVLIRDGRLDEAQAHVERFEASVRESGLYLFRAVAELFHSVRARCLIATLMRAPANRELFRQARKAARPRRGTRSPLRIGEGILYAAALRSLAGDDDGARRGWREAIAYCERQHLDAHLAAARLRLTEHTGGIEHGELEAAGLAYLTEQGIPTRRAFVDMLAPARGG